MTKRKASDITLFSEEDLDKLLFDSSQNSQGKAIKDGVEYDMAELILMGANIIDGC